VGTSIVPIRMRILIGNFPLQQSHIRVTLGFNQGRVGKRGKSYVYFRSRVQPIDGVAFKRPIERIENSFER
jgi:hypothetical protein